MANAFDHEPNIVQRGCLISSSAYLISRPFFGLDQETSYNEREREREREREKVVCGGQNKEAVLRS